MRLLVFDYVPGAGVLADVLRRQERPLLRALLADLVELPGIELVTIDGPGPFRPRFAAGLRAADAVWPLAPAAGGMLERLSREVLRSERILLGSKPEALRVAGSRRRTSRTLAGAGIAVAAVYAPRQCLPANVDAWVVKPDDGDGCLDSRIFAGARAAQAWIAASGAARYVLQPFIPGKLCSLSLLCCDGAAQLLGCNEQRVAVRDNQFEFLGTTVNSIADADGGLARLAQAVAAAIPGLWGHVGIDFVAGGRGPVVLEVQARLTPSYAGLHASLGCNPAALLLELLGRPAGVPPMRARPVAVSVDVAP